MIIMGTTSTVDQLGSVSGTRDGTPETYPSVKKARRMGKTPTDAWREVTAAKSRLRCMREMKKDQVGYNVDEDYVRKLSRQGRIRGGSIRKLSS